jgi:glycosyltransferase involved in cell wall biosynthesis
MHCYWAARGLAARGHTVFVVTNANEVEDTFRIRLTDADLEPGGEYAKEFPKAGGSVHVVSTEPPDRSRLYYIPLGNPTVTRLATIATDVIRREGCEVVFTYYLEPYGVAAHLASSWTGVPYVLKHAGSDLNRLMALDELKTAYVEVMLAASRVLSRGPSRRQLLSHGIPESRISSEVAFGIPTAYFNPEAPPLDLRPFRAAGAAAGPILGVYGKLGEYKGSFDLLHAFARLLDSGIDAELVAVAHGWQEQRFVELVRELGLERSVTLLQFLPPWRIPGFIRACTAICFLEREFPIAAHTPTIPSEVIACGACLIVSEEVARKQALARSQLRNRRNAIIVSDPRDTSELADCLRFALADPSRASAIGTRGFEELSLGPSHELYVAQLESLLATVAGEGARAPHSRPDVEEPRARTDPLQMIERLYPYTRALLDQEHERSVRERLGGTALGRDMRDRSELALAVGDALLATLAESGARGSGSPAVDVCRYERACYRWSQPQPAQRPEAFRPVALDEAVDELQPVLAGEYEIQEFGCDVEAIMSALDENEEPPRVERPTKVLFRSGSLPLRIGDATEGLLHELGGGSPTVADLVEAVTQSYGSDEARLRELCLSALEGLYWEGIVEFRGVGARASASRRTTAARAPPRFETVALRRGG